VRGQITKGNKRGGMKNDFRGGKRVTHFPKPIEGPAAERDHPSQAKDSFLAKGKKTSIG